MVHESTIGNIAVLIKSFENGYDLFIDGRFTAHHKDLDTLNDWLNAYAELNGQM